MKPSHKITIVSLYGTAAFCEAFATSGYPSPLVEALCHSLGIGLTAMASWLLPSPFTTTKFRREGDQEAFEEWLKSQGSSNLEAPTEEKK